MTNEIRYPWPVIQGVPSAFSSDSRFTPKNSAGQSKEEISAASVTDAMRKQSTIHGMSPRADELLRLRKSGIDLDPKSIASNERRKKIAKASI